MCKLNDRYLAIGSLLIYPCHGVNIGFSNMRVTLCGGYDYTLFAYHCDYFYNTMEEAQSHGRIGSVAWSQRLLCDFPK